MALRRASPEQLIGYATTHSWLFYAGAWFQVTGTLLSVVFYLAIIQAANAQGSFWGHVLLVTACSLLAVVLADLMKRRYPFVEEIAGRVYVDLKSANSARDLGLLILWQRGTRRINREDLIQSIQRQRRNVTLANARMAVHRLSDVLDDDGQGNLRLRNAGFREADELIAQIDRGPVRRRKSSKHMNT